MQACVDSTRAGPGRCAQHVRNHDAQARNVACARRGRRPGEFPAGDAVLHDPLCELGKVASVCACDGRVNLRPVCLGQNFARACEATRCAANEVMQGRTGPADLDDGVLRANTQDSGTPNAPRGCCASR